MLWNPSSCTQHCWQLWSAKEFLDDVDIITYSVPQCQDHFSNSYQENYSQLRVERLVRELSSAESEISVKLPSTSVVRQPPTDWEDDIDKTLKIKTLKSLEMVTLLCHFSKYYWEHTWKHVTYKFGDNSEQSRSINAVKETVKLVSCLWLLVSLSPLASRGPWSYSLKHLKGKD